MTPELHLPREWRRIQQIGTTGPLVGRETTAVFKNPGQVQVVEFHGCFYEIVGGRLKRLGPEHERGMKQKI